MTRYAIGVDVGGTFIKAGLVDDTGRILFKHRQPTPPPTQPEPVVGAIIEAGRAVGAWAQAQGYTVQGVGFGLPELTEGPDWMQRQANNLPGLEGYALRPPLQASFGNAIAIDNDVSAAALGEYHYGAGREYERVLFMAIGTGISCGVFTEEGRLVRYNYSTAGDTGHIIVAPYGPLCTCGGRGCLEAVASAPAVAHRGREAAETGKSPALARTLATQGDITARAVAEAAVQDDPAARAIFDEIGWFLGVGLTSLVHIFRPHAILVGGGLAEAGDLLLEPIRATLTQLGSPFYLGQLQAVKPARLGADAGIIGAAALIFHNEGIQ